MLMLAKPVEPQLAAVRLSFVDVKVAAAGASPHVPLEYRDDSWPFPHFDTITVSVAGAARSTEALVMMAITDGVRPRNRCGTEPIRYETASPIYSPASPSSES